VADALSRWAYPASQAFADVSVHGSEEDDRIMREFIEAERKEERQCLRVLRVPEAMAQLRRISSVQLDMLRVQEVQAPEPERTSIRQLMTQLESVSVLVTTRRGARTGGGQEEVAEAPPPPPPQEEVGAQPLLPPAPGPSSTEPSEVDPWEVDEWGNLLHPPNQSVSPSVLLPSSPSVSQSPQAAGPTPSDPSPRRRASSEPEVSPENSPDQSQSVSEEPATPNPHVAQPERAGPPGEEVLGDLEEPGDPPTAANVMERDWVPAYDRCPEWGPVRRQALDNPEWPQGIQWERDKMFKEGLLCVPKSLQGPVIRAHHSVAGHPGGERLWAVMARRYLFADPRGARRMAERVKGQCEVCQVTDPSRVPYKCTLEASPIPPTSWTVCP